MGEPLYMGAIFPHPPQARFKEALETLVGIVDKYGCTIIALGNGHGCRETEKLLHELRLLRPKCVFTIVNEAGVSVYSVTEKAGRELPKLDPVQRSAVGLARRLQDPISELIKVEPRHLGVGMYQHDIPEKLLDQCLTDVVQDSVALVGANINSCGEDLLSYIPGLSTAKARAIVEHRSAHGSFRTREDLKAVHGIGHKTFEQCAGFLRVIPSQEDAQTILRLEATRIHPDSYATGTALLSLLGAKWSHLGTEEIRHKASLGVRV
jgi:uncharacterized protein